GEQRRHRARARMKAGERSAKGMAAPHPALHAAPRSALHDPACSLCEGHDAGTTGTIADTDCLRVVRATDVAGFPALYRVIWREHVRELSDLSPRQRAVCIEVVALVERALRQLAPAKINIASLGNMVP